MQSESFEVKSKSANTWHRSVLRHLMRFGIAEEKTASLSSFHHGQMSKPKMTGSKLPPVPVGDANNLQNSWASGLTFRAQLVTIQTYKTTPFRKNTMTNTIRTNSENVSLVDNGTFWSISTPIAGGGRSVIHSGGWLYIKNIWNKDYTIIHDRCPLTNMRLTVHGNELRDQSMYV